MATTRYGDIRARDTDRADVCGLLDAALSDGQLSADEHAARTANAMRAKSFGELDELIGDLQIPDDLVDAPVVRVDRRRPRRWLAPVSLIAAAAVAGALVGGISRCATGSSENVPPLTTGVGLAYFLDEYRAEFGDMSADEVTLYPEYALVDRKSPGNAAQVTEYRYDGGFRGWTTTQRESGARSLDLAALDVPAVAALLAGAPRTLKCPDGTITHIGVEFESSGSIDLGPVLEIYVKDKDGSSGNMTITFTGKTLRLFPPNR